MASAEMDVLKEISKNNSLFALAHIQRLKQSATASVNDPNGRTMQQVNQGWYRNRIIMKNIKIEKRNEGATKNTNSEEES